MDRLKGTRTEANLRIGFYFNLEAKKLLKKTL